jgi:hypothetical protein
MISVAIPFYNTHEFLEKCLENLLDYKFINEIVIVDDCSKKEIFYNHKKVKIIRNRQNIGAFKNKYSAVKNSANRWVYLLDSDNSIPLNSIKSLENINTQKLDADTIYCPSSLILKNVFRFNEYGLDNGGQTQNTGDSDFSKYWNSSKNDYILKTQIVPPVCPTCPTCPSTGTCSNCGGSGGSGTLSNTGNSMLPNNSGTNSGPNQNYSRLGSGTVESNANPDTIGGSLTLSQYDLTATVEDVAKTGAGVVTGVAGTIGGVANNLISTTGSVLKPNPMGGISSDTSAQNAADGTGNNQRSTPGYTAPGLGTSNQYSDPYSYYGQLPPKGKTNYVPVTADFSRFGR